MSDSENEEAARRDRAARRRANWSGGVAHDFAEMDDVDLDFWLRATPEERIGAMRELLAEMSWIGGEDGAAPRLQRSVGGARPRRS